MFIAVKYHQISAEKILQKMPQESEHGAVPHLLQNSDLCPAT